MKIESLIAQYFYQSKKLTLQNIGTFYLSPDVNLTHDPEQGIILPENAILFEYNKDAPADDALIDYIIKQTKKIKPLATSDLESFTILSKQFLNIGKALELKGLGYLIKNQTGQIEFTQEEPANNKAGELPNQIEKEIQTDHINFSSPPPIKRRKNWLLPILITAVALLISIILFLFLRDKKDASEIKINVADTIPIKKDSAPPVINNTQSLKPDSLKATIGTGSQNADSTIKNIKDSTIR